MLPEIRKTGNKNISFFKKNILALKVIKQTFPLKCCTTKTFLIKNLKFTEEFYNKTWPGGINYEAFFCKKS
jgi:hypothetical protein